jgi:F0F1-type ATP synthase assembly protein I
MTATAERKKQSALEGFTAALALSVFVGAILVATLLVVSTAYLVLTQPWSPWTWTLAVLTVSSSGNSRGNSSSSSSSSSVMMSGAVQQLRCITRLDMLLCTLCSQP